MADAGLLNYIDNETPRSYFINGHADLEEVERFAESLVKDILTICEEGNKTQTTSNGIAILVKNRFEIR